MKIRTIILILSVLTFWIQGILAQQITNVRAEQNERTIDITYDLTGLETGSWFAVSIYCSTDGGKTYGSALKSVTGDVGNGITGGTGKKITWNVLADLDEFIADNAVFKVVAKETS